MSGRSSWMLACVSLVLAVGRPAVAQEQLENPGFGNDVLGWTALDGTLLQYIGLGGNPTPGMAWVTKPANVATARVRQCRPTHASRLMSA